MEQSKTDKQIVSHETSISWKEAKAHGNGNLFKNHEKKGSVSSWRFRRGTGHNPNFYAMSEITPFEKTKHDKYCQCKEPVMNAFDHLCTKCNHYFDLFENKRLISYKICNV